MSLATKARHLIGNKAGLALEELHHHENALGASLRRLSDRHKADHEVHHVARDIAGWSDQHLRELARIGEEFGLELDSEPSLPHEILARARRKGSELAGRFHEPGLLLLWDLREVHRAAAGVKLDWEVLAQTAQAMKHPELIELCEQSQPQTERQQKWAEAQLKVMSPQIMAT